MKGLVFDLETDGLLDELTTIHSLVIQDLESGVMHSYADADGYLDIETGLNVLRSADKLYAHNAIGFDIPAIQKVYPEWEPEGEVMDTLVLARLRFAHIKDDDYPLFKKDILPGNLIGSHKLEAWGYRLEVWKGDYGGGWEEWSPAMQEYCEQDVTVTVALLEHLHDSGLPERAVEIEHALARYLRKQKENGWPFSVSGATKLQAKLASIRQDIEADLIEEVGWWYGSKGQTNPKRSFTRRKNFDVPRHYYEGAPYTRLKKVTFNPASRQHIAKVLQDQYGWEPTVFTPKSGQPKVSEEILKGLDYDIADKLVEYLTVSKRLGQVAEGRQAWLRHAEEHPETGLPHIHHNCYQKPRTHRNAHSSPNLAQVPANDAPYGEECRALFNVPDGWVQLGADVSGLELRTVAHYMHRWDEGAYAELVLKKDPHMATHDAVVEMVTSEMRVRSMDHYTRGSAKGTNYAYLYGAGDETLGRTVTPAGVPDRVAEEAGKLARSAIESRFAALGILRASVEEVVNRRGYVRLIDGRRAYPAAHYASLNTLIQGTGAIVCKAWVVDIARRFRERFGTQGWDGRWAALGFIHDEIQLAVRPDIAEETGRLTVEAVKAVGQDFDFNLPLDADFDIGSNWSETH